MKDGGTKKERKIPMLTADPLIVTDDGRVVLIKRRSEPFAGKHALPGGFVEYGERVEDACVREAKEETGLDVETVKILGVYSKPGRDPRGHVVTVVFLCRPVGGEMKKTEETLETKAFSGEEMEELDFASDHRQILRDAGFI